VKALRRYAVARTLFRPTTLLKAIERLGYVQADPIRAPERAQDLILRHRVKGYRAGDLERAYAKLPIEETFFINHGFVPRDIYALMHPRSSRAAPWVSDRLSFRSKHVRAVLDFVTERGSVHPREVEAKFQRGTVKNYWGGQSSATTHLLGKLHYLGHVRVVRRENGIRIYGPSATGEHAAPLDERIDALVDLVVGLYAPLPKVSLQYALSRLRYAMPHEPKAVAKGIKRAKERLASDGTWFWPVGEKPDADAPDEVRLLAPFDPIVWDRRRFELLWNWGYRFEAYTPAKKRLYGYYALPLLWRDDVVGWANIVDDALVLGFVRRPKERGFRSALENEVARFELFTQRPLKRVR
jgi:uncharacterized protein YcaQ